MENESNLSIQLRILHDYFKDGIARNISIKPTEETRKLLSANGIVFKKEINGFDLVNTSIQETRDFYSQALDVENVDHFEFELTSVDPNFQVYTELPMDKLGHFVFSNLSSETTENSEILKLDKSFIEDNPTQNLGLLKFDIKELIAQLDDNNLKFEIHLEARKTQWNYFIIAPDNVQDLKIQSSSDFNFEGPSKETLPNGNSSMKFTSGDKLIALQENPSLELLLVDSSKNPEVTIMRLPHAGPDRIEVESVGESSIVASNMYVYL